MAQAAEDGVSKSYPPCFGTHSGLRSITVKTAIDTTTQASFDDVRKETLALWERNRLRCGWFLRDDFSPRTEDDLRLCLNMLARHGDRATYVLARKLMKCL